MSNPSDLNIVTQPDTDKNYFNFKAAGLKIDRNYAIKFQWVYEDGTVSEWSAGKFINTATENVPGAVTATVPSTSTGSIPVTLSNFPANTKRVDIYVIGGEFGTGKVADYFLSAGTKSIAVSGGVYNVSLIAVTPSNINGTPTNTFTITVSTAGETVQAPTNPNGFSIDRVLSGIQVNWAGTYANGTFTGFEAIKIYVGNSATATSGSYKDAGVMTGNNVANSITIPVDGTYLRYDLPVYIHAAAVNKNGTVGTLQANVANNSLGARSAISSDLADEIITNAKLVADSVTSTKIALGAITEVKIDTNAITAAKIAAGAVTETKILDGAISSPKIVAGAIDAGKIAAGAVTTEKLDALAITADKIAANAITSDKIIANAITAGKIDALAITSEKIAADAITATKIKAGEIDVLKLAAGTISVNNLDAGTIKSTSYIRAGSKNLTTGLGARVEISSAAIEDGTVDIAAGFYIYNSSGTAVLSAPLNGGLSIVGSGTFTGNITGASGTFGGALDVGTTTLANITGASSVTESSVTRVRFTANNTLKVNDVVTISGIAQNQTFAYWAGPGTTNPVYNYSNNPFNLGTVTVYAATATTFDIQSSVTGTYTSGGVATGSAFKVTSTGIVRAAAGQIGGWDINSTQIRSSGTDYISLNPITPGIEIVSPSQGTITINPITGIKDSAGKFTLSPNGNLSLSGSITSGSTITGADITMTGSVNGNGIASTKLLFSASNYAISAGSSSYTYPGTSGYYDENGDWIDASAPQTVTNTDIRFTDATLGGAVPAGTSTFSYGELWLGGGTGASSTVDLWANYPGGFIGISVAASSTSKNIYIYGDSSAGFDTVHRSSTTDASKESPAFLQVDSAGRMSRGRAIITGGSSAPSNTLGLTGDLYFSTAT
jgi:hypothetical protein